MLFGIIFNLWQEPDVHNGFGDDKRASLLMMNFSVNEVAFAIDKLGRYRFVKSSFKNLTLNLSVGVLGDCLVTVTVAGVEIHI